VDLFPEELPGLPPSREVKFTTDLLPGTTPLSKLNGTTWRGDLSVRVYLLGEHQSYL
jgi:hypothetical protein